MNDNWHYTAMIQNQQYFEGKNESGDSDTNFQRAYLNGNIGVVNITPAVSMTSLPMGTCSMTVPTLSG